MFLQRKIWDFVKIYFYSLIMVSLPLVLPNHSHFSQTQLHAFSFLFLENKQAKTKRILKRKTAQET